jgi:hypothetical protein
MRDTPFESGGHPQNDLNSINYTRSPLPLHPENIPASNSKFGFSQYQRAQSLAV